MTTATQKVDSATRANRPVFGQKTAVPRGEERPKVKVKLVHVDERPKVNSVKLEVTTEAEVTTKAKEVAQKRPQLPR